jgi:acyl carrier protein
MHLENELCEHIGRHIANSSAPVLVKGDDNLLELVDSIEIIRIVSFVEKKYGVEFADHELNPENLGSVRRLAELVARYRRENP